MFSLLSLILAAGVVPNFLRAKGRFGYAGSWLALADVSPIACWESLPAPTERSATCRRQWLSIKTRKIESLIRKEAWLEDKRPEWGILLCNRVYEYQHKIIQDLFLVSLRTRQTIQQLQ
jgi:hypothetical protein